MHAHHPAASALLERDGDAALVDQMVVQPRAVGLPDLASLLRRRVPSDLVVLALRARVNDWGGGADDAGAVTVLAAALAEGLPHLRRCFLILRARGAAMDDPEDAHALREEVPAAVLRPLIERLAASAPRLQQLEVNYAYGAAFPAPHDDDGGLRVLAAPVPLRRFRRSGDPAPHHATVVVPATVETLAVHFQRQPGAEMFLVPATFAATVGPRVATLCVGATQCRTVGRCLRAAVAEGLFARVRRLVLSFEQVPPDELPRAPLADLVFDPASAPHLTHFTLRLPLADAALRRTVARAVEAAAGDSLDELVLLLDPDVDGLKKKRV